MRERISFGFGRRGNQPASFPRGRSEADRSRTQVLLGSSAKRPHRKIYRLFPRNSPAQIQKKSSASTSCGRRARGFLMLAAVVVVRCVEPGAVRLFDPPAHRAGLQKNIPIRVYPCPSVVKNARFSVFRPKIAIFHRKTAQNGPKTAFSDPFSPARPVAARVSGPKTPFSA